MAPPPEYDREPKAPDKSTTSIPGDDSKALHNVVNDHQNNSDSKTVNATANVEIENNKHVEHLDDGQLKALLDEAITYKCPKDREGKSSLFNELLEEVEQDEQALEAAARELSGGRAARRAARGRRALAHSNSLQDLEQEALAAECALRRVRHASHAPANVSARAIHGGSLPSDVDKSFLLGEESSGRGGYLATVRCVNPPPLNERRVSASDAHEHEPTPRRSKPAFPMTYTARATLEIGSGSVGSGRAVTTTTASNQVRTPPRRPLPAARRPRHPHHPHWTPHTTGPPARLYADRLYNPYHQPDYYLYKPPKSHGEMKRENLNELCQSQRLEVATLPPVIEEESVDGNQRKLLDALTPKAERGGGNEDVPSDNTANVRRPRGPSKKKTKNKEKKNIQNQSPRKETRAINSNDSLIWMNRVNSWYDGLESYSSKPVKEAETSIPQQMNFTNVLAAVNVSHKNSTYGQNFPMQTAANHTQANKRTSKNQEVPSSSNANTILPCKAMDHMQRNPQKVQVIRETIEERTQRKHNTANSLNRQKDNFKLLKDITYKKRNQNFVEFVEQDVDTSLINTEVERLKYRKRVGSLIPPKVTCVNPKNVRRMTIGKSFITEGFSNKVETSKEVNDSSPVGAKSADADADNNVITPILNKIQSSNIDENPKLNSQPSEHDKSLENNNNVSCKKSENPTAEILSERVVSDNKIDEKSSGLSRCEEVIEEMVHISTTNQDISDNFENFSNGSKDPDVTRDNIGGMDLTQVSNKNDVALIEMKDLSNTKGSVNEDKDTELSVISPSGNTQDSNIQDQTKVVFESTPTVETESMNKEEHNAVIELSDLISSKPSTNEEEGIELLEVKPENPSSNSSFLKYLNDQRRLFQILEANSCTDNSDIGCVPEQSLGSFRNISDNNSQIEHETSTRITEDEHELKSPKSDDNSLDANDLQLQVIKKDYITNSEQYVLGVIPSNAFVFLTFPKSLAMPSNHLTLHEVETDTTPAENTTTKRKKKKRPVPSGSGSSNKRVLSREEFRALLFHNALKSETERQKGTSGAPGRQIDSAIPFNCITSPEVVDACSTTSSAQASVVEETKPLQLGWGYRAVASLTGARLAAAAPPAPALQHDRRQPRSVISSSFNGLPLARSSYGSTGTTTSSDEYKKSLDENGNSLQGFSSPQSGSSHNKKPRRKKSSKNETVITSHQIDGYKGDKDLNEVLRFIESDAEPRHKLGRAKHRDDAAADDKAGKKRSADRRKDKETKMKRATSMEELSRTKLEDLTDARRPAAPAKPERRSWGDDARDAFYFRDDASAAAADAGADFQTVTKKRKPRRRADEPEPEPPRARPPPPAPRARRVSAPPSDRSADSNDDMDSVHSLPADAPRLAAPPPAPAPASYADIARTRHNIPDLIESCNFYAEGAAREAREAGEARAARGDADGYPALEPRLHRRPRDHHPKPPAPQARSRDRKEARSVTCVPEPAAACPAPDVVADRRPPVILLDSAARPGDMDGVTFGFDINEQLLGGSTRRPRCDLVRDAVESDAAKKEVVTPPEAEPVRPSPGEEKPAVDSVKPAVDAVKPVVETPVAVKPVGCAVAAAAAAAGGVAVAAGCGALRWVPPHAPHDSHHLLQIVDYVGQAWEDVVRCGSGKVRYFAE